MADKPTYEALKERIDELEALKNQLRTSEHSLRLSETRLNAFLSSAPVGMAIWDRDLRYLYINDVLVRINGPSREAHLGRTISEVLPRAASIIDPLFKQIAATGEPILNRELSGEVPSKPGEITHYLVSYFPMADRGGALLYFGGIVVEITDRIRAEEALKKSEAKFRTLFENMAQGVFYQKADGRLIDVNPAALNMLGVTRDQFLGRTSMNPRWKVVDARGADLPGGRHPSMVALATGKAVRNALIGVHNPLRDALVWLSVNAIPQFKPGERRPYQVVGTLHDITERIIAEKRAMEQRQRLRLALESADEGVWEWDARTDRVTVDKLALRMLGYAPDQPPMQTKWWLEQIHPEDRTMAEQAYVAVFSGERDTFQVEIRFRHKTGGYIWVASTARILRHDSKGQPILVVGIQRDITARKAALDTQRASEERLLRAQEAGKVGIWELDLQTHIATFSDEFARIHGIEGNASPMERLMELVPLEDRPATEDAFQAAFVQGDEYNIEHRITRRDTGEVRWVRARGRVTGQVDGKPARLSGSTRDITRRKQADAERAMLQAQIQQAQKMESIGLLAGGIAHDFNNILSAIIGFTELSIDAVEEGSNIKDYLQEVYTAGTRAKDLVRQILTFARQSEEEVKPFPVHVIAREALKFIRSSIPTTIRVNQNIQSDSVIMGSPTQVHQIFMNLFTNAAQAMEERGGTLEVGLQDIVIHADSDPNSRALKPGDYTQIKIADTGVGIPPDRLRSIFEPYFTTKPPGEGTGMGLAVVHGIVESHSGKLMVDSQVGRGTTFRIYFPIAKKHSSAPPHASNDLPMGKERILLVDDEIAIASLGQRLLERLGYAVTTRTSSVEALALFQAQPLSFDLIITDMTMPNLTGDRLAAELLRIRPQVPIILCTGYSRKLSEENVQAMGIKALIYKPIIKADLAKAVREALDAATLERPESTVQIEPPTEGDAPA